MKDISEMLHKTTLTISCPLDLYIWLKQTKRNCSAFIVEAVQEKKERDAQLEQVEA